MKTADGYLVDSGNGNDTVIGGVGDDSITGGAGNDSLTGGQGADTFTFSRSDFFSYNESTGLEVYNKAVDTITDFKPGEGDTLDFGDLGDLSFYNSLTAAKADAASLFFSGGSVYLNTDTSDDGSKYNAVPILNFTIKPVVLSDNSGFASPVGGAGDDDITGSAGNDSLTGGQGADTFTFSRSDFFSYNESTGLEVYNKAVDTITDFKLGEGDALDLGDLGALEFYSSLKEANDMNSQLFYTGGKVYLNTADTSNDSSNYSATAIITLIGNPILDA